MRVQVEIESRRFNAAVDAHTNLSETQKSTRLKQKQYIQRYWQVNSSKQ